MPYITDYILILIFGLLYFLSIIAGLYGKVFNNEHKTYPKMSMKQPTVEP